MHQLSIATGLATIHLMGQQAIAVDQAQKAKAPESKAEIMEENAAAGGSKARASPSEITTKPETQVVDPVGTEPLDEAITCLSRTLYWEARGEDATSMEAVANVVMNRLGHKGFPKRAIARRAF